MPPFSCAGRRSRTCIPNSAPLRYAAVRTGLGGPDRGLDVRASDSSVYGAICRIGGNNGWSMSWLWRIRGWLDHLAGGPGLRRGRRDPNRLRFGDALDFWRVVAIQSNRHLSLRAEMRLPGAAILDFRISRQIAKGPGVSEEMLFALRSVERSSECFVFRERVLDLPDDRFRSGNGPTSGSASTRSGPARPRGAPAGSDARSEHARLCQSERIAGRRHPFGKGGREFHPRPHAQSRAGDGREGRRAAGRGLRIHHGIEGQQDLSRHRARAQHLCPAGPGGPHQADRQQPSRSLHAPGGGVCSQAIRPRHGGAVHRRGGWTGPDVVHGAGQSDRRAPGAGDDCDLHRQRQRRRPGQPARPGVRHDVRACTRSSSRRKCCPWWRSNTT